jgi:hypothetical protein
VPILRTLSAATFCVLFNWGSSPRASGLWAQSYGMGPLHAHGCGIWNVTQRYTRISPKSRLRQHNLRGTVIGFCKSYRYVTCDHLPYPGEISHWNYLSTRQPRSWCPSIQLNGATKCDCIATKDNKQARDMMTVRTSDLSGEAIATGIRVNLLGCL